MRISAFLRVFLGVRGEIEYSESAMSTRVCSRERTKRFTAGDPRFEEISQSIDCLSSPGEQFERIRKDLHRRRAYEAHRSDKRDESEERAIFAFRLPRPKHVAKETSRVDAGVCLPSLINSDR